MQLAIALNSWKHGRHGPRVQAKAISFIANRMEIQESYNLKCELEPILKDCRNQATPDVTERMLRRWWETYEEWGELPYHFWKIKTELDKEMMVCKKSTISDGDLMILKEMVDENPNIYLDELTLAFIQPLFRLSYQCATRIKNSRVYSQHPY